MNTAPLTSGLLDPLDEIYRRLTAQPSPDFGETWRLLAANKVYLSELRLAAGRLLRNYRLPRDRQDDVVQEALVVLHQRLRHCANLDFDPRYGQEHLLPWLRAVVRLHCLHALRRTRGRKGSAWKIDAQSVACYRSDTAWRLEFADAVQTLDEPLREVLIAFGQHGTLEEVGRQLGISTTTAWRRLQAALRQVRPHCRPPSEGGCPPGCLKIVRKW